MTAIVGIEVLVSEHHFGAIEICLRVKVKTMDAMVIGAAFVGSMATAFVVQKAVLGAMFRALGRGKAKRR